MQKRKRIILFTVLFALVTLSVNNQVWGDDGPCATTMIYEDGKMKVEYSGYNCSEQTVYFCDNLPCPPNPWRQANTVEYWLCMGPPASNYSNCTLGNCGPRETGCIFLSYTYPCRSYACSR